MSAYDTYKNAILGVPFAPNKQPSRQGAVQAFAEMQQQLEGAQSGALVKDTLVNLQALTSVSETSIMAWVVNDATQANNGIYENTGTASNPSWTRRLDIPQFVISAINSGSGTANAIQAETDLPIPVQDGRCMIILNIISENTDSVTVNFNSGNTLTVKSVSGQNLQSSNLTSGMYVAGFIRGSDFRLLSDVASSSVLNQAAASATNAAASATNAAASATNAAASATNAAASATNAAASAIAAGASIYDTIANGLSGTSNADVFIVQHSYGSAVYRNDSGNETLIGWIGEINFDNVTSLENSTVSGFAEGSYVQTKEEGYRYKIAANSASDHDLQNNASTPVKFYARPVDGPIFMRSFGSFDLTGSSDVSSEVQGFIDYAQRNGKHHGILPEGTFLIDGTLKIGNASSGFYALHLQGATGSFLGNTKFVHAIGQNLNPLIDISGVRSLTISDISIRGNNNAPASRNGENFRDSEYLNWVSPGISDGRYNPYAAICFSGLYGAQPSNSNDRYTFDSYGETGLASKVFLEKLDIRSFVCAVILAPNSGTPGVEDISIKDSSIVENTFGICTTGSQQRNVYVENCNMQGSWCIFDNVTFGAQQGQPVHSKNNNLGKSVVSFQSSTDVGVFIMRDTYFENVRSVGVSGKSPSSARFSDFFENCNFSIIGHDDDGTEDNKDVVFKSSKKTVFKNCAWLSKYLTPVQSDQEIIFDNVEFRCENVTYNEKWDVVTPISDEWKVSLENCKMRSYSGAAKYINDVEKVNTISNRALINRNCIGVVSKSNGRSYKIERHPITYRGPNVSNISYVNSDQITFNFTSADDKPIYENDLLMWRTHVSGINNARDTTIISPSLIITDITGSTVTCKILTNIDTSYVPSAIDAVVQNFVNSTEANGDTTNGSPDITNVSNISNFQVGDWIRFFDNLTYVSQIRIDSISGTTITCHRNLNVTDVNQSFGNARLIEI